MRYDDDEGLLTTSARSAGNYRLHTERDVERMRVIMAMKPLGFSLEEMGQLLAALDAVRDTAGGSGAGGGERARASMGHFAAGRSWPPGWRWPTTSSPSCSGTPRPRGGEGRRSLIPTVTHDDPLGSSP